MLLNPLKTEDNLRPQMNPSLPAAGFAAVCTMIALPAFLLPIFAPLGYSIAAVFLFAGPHNWAEFRFFVARMPARWGRLSAYFLTGIGGVVLLGGARVALAVSSHTGYWSDELHEFATTLWLACLAVWVGVLFSIRSFESGCLRLRWALPACLVLAALACWYPIHCFFALVYLHPLIAFVFLDRELKMWKPEWRRTYHLFLCTLPFLLAGLYWSLKSAHPLVAKDRVSFQIIFHAGGGHLDLSAHFLVAAHAALETLHYGVWLLAMPYLSYRGAPWSLKSVALARRSVTIKKILCTVFLLGALAVLLLWIAFWMDYGITRDVYFTIAIFHILAEFPFLVRAV